MRKSLDFDRVGEILREAADTLVCPRFRRLDEAAISIKSHQNDLVTIADLEAEIFLTRELTALLPGSRALGEEAVYQDPSSKAVLDTDAPVWIIDPVDGTANFARGSTAFGIIVALVRDRRTVAGWIYDPLQQRLFTAEAGAGTWSGGQRLTVAPRGGRGLDGLSGCISRRMAERHRCAVLHHYPAGQRRARLHGAGRPAPGLPPVPAAQSLGSCCGGADGGGGGGATFACFRARPIRRSSMPTTGC